MRIIDRWPAIVDPPIAGPVPGAVTVCHLRWGRMRPCRRTSARPRRAPSVQAARTWTWSPGRRPSGRPPGSARTGSSTRPACWLEVSRSSAGTRVSRRRGCGEDPAGDRLAWGGPEVVAQGGGGQADPDDHEVAAVQGGSGGQVACGGVDGTSRWARSRKVAPARMAARTRHAPRVVRAFIQLAPRRRWAEAAGNGGGVGRSGSTLPWGRAARAQDARSGRRGSRCDQRHVGLWDERITGSSG
jgi:hypothetical protein